MSKISVVCPAYKRPKYTQDLIKSFLFQNYRDSELVIVDDSGDYSLVGEIVRKFAAEDSRIKYVKNPQNLGFCKNLINAILCANYEYVLIMGDDDILGSEDTLTKYVEVFDSNPDVNYVYSNQIQFNQNYNTDYVYKHFEQNKKYEAGKDSIDNTWLLSCFISGLAVRKTNLKDLYPSDNILFPQVEMVGKLILNSASYSIGQFLIGSRAHNEQLGFKAVKGNDIKNTEKHSVYELNMIYDRILDYAKQNNISTNLLDRNVVNNFFENKHMTIFPGEKINTGNSKIVGIFFQAVKNNKKVLLNAQFMFYFLISLILPGSILVTVKEWKKSQYIKKFSHDINLFNQFLKKVTTE